MKAIPNFKSWLLTEAIIDWQGQGADELLDQLMDPSLPNMRFEDFKRMAEPYGVEVVRYDQFIREIPEEHRESAPPPNAPFFALLNPVTERPRVVINVPLLFARERREISKMLKHEFIHLGQLHRRPVGLAVGGWDVKNQEEYFSNKDEIMAFAHSVTDELISMGAKSVEDGIKLLSRSRMWAWIKDNAKESALKRYRKYIYFYLKLELEGEA